MSFLGFKKKKKNDGALHCKDFQKHPLFTTLSLFSKLSEGCNISNKCLFPHKSANKIFLKKISYTPSSFEKRLRSPWEMLLETSTFDDDHDCFCDMVDRRKAFSLISSRDHYKRSSPSRISKPLRAGYEPSQNLSSGLIE